MEFCGIKRLNGMKDVEDDEGCRIIRVLKNSEILETEVLSELVQKE